MSFSLSLPATELMSVRSVVIVIFITLATLTFYLQQMNIKVVMYTKQQLARRYLFLL